MQCRLDYISYPLVLKEVNHFGNSLKGSWVLGTVAVIPSGKVHTEEVLGRN